MEEKFKNLEIINSEGFLQNERNSFIKSDLQIDNKRRDLGIEKEELEAASIW